ncbi:hypothetical protein CQ10_29890 [Bradyrhizobium valentinum]|nr:hypothetical protein CQ10_29890 [Bradyrhizobium valentinum]
MTARGGRGVMPGTNNAFVMFSDVQKTCEGERLVVKNLNIDIAKGEFSRSDWLSRVSRLGSNRDLIIAHVAEKETQAFVNTLADCIGGALPPMTLVPKPMMHSPTNRSGGRRDDSAPGSRSEVT